MRIVLL